MPGDSQPYALYVNWNPFNRKANLNANPVDNVNSEWAAPVVVRDCSEKPKGVATPSFLAV